MKKELTNIKGGYRKFSIYKKMYIKTPILQIKGPNGAKIFLKDETKQLTGAFKVRGVLNKFQRTDLSKYSGVITASTGNHGQAVALCAKNFNQKCCIVVPENTPDCKKNKIRDLGAEIVNIKFSHYEECMEWAKKHAKKEGLLYIPSFDDLDIIEGHISLFEECKDLDVELCFCSIGGGGLVSAALLSPMSAKSRIVGVELLHNDAMKRSLENKKNLKIKLQNNDKMSFCEGLLVNKVGNIPFRIAMNKKLKVVTVSKKEIKDAIKLLNDYGIVAEGAGASSLAAATRYKKNSLCIISGGNIDPSIHNKIIKGDDSL